MARVKRAVNAQKKRRVILERASGYRGQRSRLYRKAKEQMLHSATYSYRCAAHEYRTFAGGHLHYLMYNKLMPWDHLAGTLIAQEAGAYAARFDGSAYQPHHTEGGLLVAPDKDTWDMLRREVFVD